MVVVVVAQFLINIQCDVCESWFDDAHYFHHHQIVSQLMKRIENSVQLNKHKKFAASIETVCKALCISWILNCIQ